MEILTKIADVQKLSDKIKNSGKLIGLVPTMGFLHQGHLSLVEEIRQHCDVVFMSIFVNPLQFAPTEDFDRYPRDFEMDKKLAESVKVDYLFYPSVDELYPNKQKTIVSVKDLQNYLDGLSRPGHFDGVTTVVAKLFNIVKPNMAIFGQKDLQQSVLVRKMVEDLNFDLQIFVAPIVREVDGLAMSSRNVYLSESERNEAIHLLGTLEFGKNMFLTGERNVDFILDGMTAYFKERTHAIIDYLSINRLDSMEPLTNFYNIDSFAILGAAKFGKTRLIDNVIVRKG